MLTMLSMLFFLIVVFVLLCFFKRVVCRPQLFGQHGTFRTHLLENCSVLQQRYWGTWWAFNGHIMTLARSVIQRRLKIKYKREIFIASDGGELPLDWYDADYYNCHFNEDTPILLILPGYSSKSEDNYVEWVVYDGASQNYRPVVMNYRGEDGVLLKTLKYQYFNSDDVESVIEHIHVCFPKVSIVAIGLSIGGMLLVKHLIKTQEHSGLLAVATFSSPWNVYNSVSLVDNKSRNFIYYNFLRNHMMNQCEMNYSNLIRCGNVDIDFCKGILEKVRNSSTLKEIITFVTKPVYYLYGYRSIKEYYEEASNQGKIHLIKTPLLSVSAIDDPLVQIFPIDEFEANSKTVFVLAPHGGHLGFIEEWLPFGRTWMNRVTQEFLQVIHTYPTEFQLK